jgi:hypothetical protein
MSCSNKHTRQGCAKKKDRDGAGGTLEQQLLIEKIVRPKKKWVACVCHSECVFITAGRG